MENKKSTGKTVAIVILIILLLGALGYITYDKAIMKETEESEKTEKKVETTTLSHEEALAIGKEKYEFIRDGLYMCGYKQLTLSQGVVSANTIGGDTTSGYDVMYHEILNIDNVKNNLTSNVFDKFVSSKLVTYQNKYYIVDGCGGDPTYASTKYQMEIKNIQDNSITYMITEYFYTIDNSGNVVEDLNKSEKYITTFGIKKENNEWKISEYEDAYTSYINNQNNQ